MGLRIKEIKSYNHRISKAEQSSVHSQKGLVLAFFITKSSWNSVKFVFLCLSLLIDRILNVDNLSWKIVTLSFMLILLNLTEY